MGPVSAKMEDAFAITSAIKDLLLEKLTDHCGFAILFSLTFSSFGFSAEVFHFDLNNEIYINEFKKPSI